MIKLTVGDLGVASVESARRQFSGTVLEIGRVYNEARARYVKVVTLADVIDGQGRSFGTQKVPMAKALEGIAIGDRIRIAATVDIDLGFTSVESKVMGEPCEDCGAPMTKTQTICRHCGAVYVNDEKLTVMKSFNFRLTRPYLLGVRSSNVTPIRRVS